MNKYSLYVFAAILFIVGFPILLAFLINSHSTIGLIILVALVSVGIGFVLDFVIKKVSTKNED